MDRIGALTITRITIGTREIAVVCSGIGKVNAAVAATTLALRYEIDLLLVVGTAGKLRPGLR